MMTTMFGRGRVGGTGRSPTADSVSDPQAAMIVPPASATPMEKVPKSAGSLMDRHLTTGAIPAGARPDLWQATAARRPIIRRDRALYGSSWT